MLAKLYVDIAESDKAIHHAKKVVELEPDDTFSYTALSVIYQRCGKIPEAEHAKALAFNKQHGLGTRLAWLVGPSSGASTSGAAETAPTWRLHLRLGLALAAILGVPRPARHGRLYYSHEPGEDWFDEHEGGVGRPLSPPARPSRAVLQGGRHREPGSPRS